MKKTFEYRVIDHTEYDKDEVNLMNSMGQKGWEIIKILEPKQWANGGGNYIRIYYRRININKDY